MPAHEIKLLPLIEIELESSFLVLARNMGIRTRVPTWGVLVLGNPVGPILIGPARPAHILTPSVTARGVLNMTAVAAVEAQERATRQQPSLFT